jgi:bla regulator protein blaR1
VSFVPTLSSIPGWILDLSPKFLNHLLDPAARTLALAALAALVLTLARSRSLSVRLTVWKVVVCAALVMPFLIAVMPALPVSVRSLDRLSGVVWTGLKSESHSPSASKQSVVDMSSQDSSYARPIVVQNGERLTKKLHIPASNAAPIKIPWSLLALVVYGAVALYLAFRFVLGWYLSRRLRQSSRVITDPDVRMQFTAHARTAQLRAAPRFAESDRLAVPLTCGVLRPAVLLPADWRTWDPETLDAVIAHEISHVARRDALTERLALLHRIVFWFSPLAWWLHRCLADLAEEASDQAALAAGMERTKYAEILLGFFNDLNSVSQRAEWQGVAMAKVGRAEQRLERILNGRRIMTTKIKKSVVALVVFSSVPAIILAASLQPRHLGPQIVFSPYASRAAVSSSGAQQASPPVATAPIVSAPPAPQATPAVAAVVAPVAAPVAQISALPVPHVLPLPLVSVVRVQAAAPAPPVPAPPVAARPAQVASPAPTAVPAPIAPPNPGFSYAFSTDREDSYAIISGKRQTMSGSFSHVDFAQLEALRNKIKGDFIWFERDGKSYVITDPETVKRATEAFAAQAELGRQQGELGRQQGSLGEMQGILGKQDGALGTEIGQLYTDLENLTVPVIDLTGEMESLASGTQELSQIVSQKDLDELRLNMAQMQKQIAEARQQIDEAQLRASRSVDHAAIEKSMKEAREAIEEQIKRFSAEQAKLGKQQGTLGREQAELAREQAAAAAKAQVELKAIINDSLSRGVAQPTPKQ